MDHCLRAADGSGSVHHVQAFGGIEIPIYFPVAGGVRALVAVHDPAKTTPGITLPALAAPHQRGVPVAPADACRPQTKNA